MSRNKFQRGAAVLLSAVLLLGAAGTVYAQGTSSGTSSQAVSAAADGNADYTKNENVYARLSADGTPDGAYIVNHFHVKKAGEITDYGCFSDVTNLSTTDGLSVQDGAVRFSVQTGNFYYQGNMTEAQLPWNFRITYTLDGKTVTPKALGGKSGALQIHFQGRKNPKADASFGDHYVMQVSLTLDNDTCDNIQASGATMADAGDGTQLSFTVLPGADADFTITADVQNFSMPGFSIAAVPYSISVDMDGFDTGDLASQFSELTDAAEQLNDGAHELLDGIRKLSSGGSSVLDGSAQLQKGLTALSRNSQSIVDASAQFNSALSAISAQLAQADFSGLSELSQLPGGLERLSGALDQLSAGLGQLKEGFDTAYQTMDGAVQSGAVSAPTQAELAAMQAACAADPTALSGYQKLLQAYKQYQTLVAVWNNVKPAFQAVSGALDANSETSVRSGIGTVSAALHTMSASLSDALGDTDMEAMLGQLRSGLAELSAGYADFHGGLCAYAEGVQTLAGNYGTFQSGLRDYTGGTGSLADGAGTYADGMSEFAAGVSRIPGRMQDTIDEMMAQYNSSDYDAVSFTDSRNENIGSVQFVISTDGVELPEAESAAAKEEHLTFWDRLLALFGLR